MKKISSVITGLFLVLFSFLFFAPAAQAHEVYVLNQPEIQAALAAPRPHFLDTIRYNLNQFLLWGMITLITLAVVLFISTRTVLRKKSHAALEVMKKWAPHVTQATVGVSLIAGSYFHAIFGTEFPLERAFGSWAPAMPIILFILGAMLLIGILPRVAAAGLFVIFLSMTAKFGFYMIHYWTYLGEALAIIIFGAAHTIFSSKRFSSFFSHTLPESAHAYKFAILRVFFGISLIYASMYAKFIHGDLALSVVLKYNLTHYFPFDPLFLVLGAMLIEVFLGLCFAIGFEIRFAAIFFLVFLTMSLVFFGEAVWPHFILIGTAISMFLHGYDRYTAGVTLVKNKELEPVL